MSKRPTVKLFLLKLINSVFTLCGLGGLGYGLHCFVKLKQASTAENANHMLVHAIQSSKSICDKPGVIYLVTGLGGSLLLVSCFGHIGVASTSPRCLLSYSVSLSLLVLAQLGVAAFIFWNQDRTKVMSTSFVNAHSWTIVRWAAVLLLIIEVIAFALALYLRVGIKRAMYDSSDDEYFVYPRKLSPLPVHSKSMRFSRTARAPGRQVLGIL